MHSGGSTYFSCKSATLCFPNGCDPGITARVSATMWDLHRRVFPRLHTIMAPLSEMHRVLCSIRGRGGRPSEENAATKAPDTKHKLQNAPFQVTNGRGCWRRHRGERTQEEKGDSCRYSTCPPPAHRARGSGKRRVIDSGAKTTFRQGPGAQECLAGQ